MGPKRMGLTGISKESSGQHAETSKKKVSEVPAKATNQKTKDNTSTVRKSATSGSLNVSLQTNANKSQIPQANKQAKKPNPTSISIPAARTPSKVSTSVKTPVSTPRKSTVPSTKAPASSVKRDKSQNALNKEVNNEPAKSFNKSRFKPKTESHISVPPSSTPNLVKNESKILREKVQSKVKKPLTATLTVDKNIIALGNDLTDDSKNACLQNIYPSCQTTVSGDYVGPTDNNSVNVKGSAGMSGDSNELKQCCADKSEKQVKNDDVIMKTEIKRINETSKIVNKQKMACSKSICASGLEGNECRTVDLENPDVNYENVESAQEDVACGGPWNSRCNYVGASIDSYRKPSVTSPNQSFKTSRTLSLCPEMFESGVNEARRNSEALIQSGERIIAEKDNVADTNIKPEESYWSTNGLESLNESLMTMVQSQSVTAMENSFDSKTFVLEEPFEIPSLGNNFIGNDKTSYININVKKQFNNPDIEDNLVSARFSSILEANDLRRLNDPSDFYLSKPNKIVSQRIPIKCGSGTQYRKSTADDDNVNYNRFKVDRESTEVTLSEKDFFNKADPLDVNLARMCNLENDILELSSDDILLKFLPGQKAKEEAVNISEDDDEFALQSEEVVDTGSDVGNCVWMDYKIPLNKPKPDVSEIWVIDQETEENYSEDANDRDAIALLEPDDQDWILTEQNLDELKACLDECKKEAEFAAKEISRLTKRNNYQTAIKGRRSSSEVRNKYLKKSYKVKEMELNQDKDYSSTEPSSNQDISSGENSDPLVNPCLVEDDIDYYSVSSGDEICDVGIKRNNEAGPQKSYLSFGKSCVKMKKRNEKKILLSFFNLFKP